MPKGSYFTAVFFFLLSFFSMPNLWGRWTWTHIHLWLLFENFGPNSPGHLPPRAGGKTAFGDRLWTLAEHISAMERDIDNRKEICQSTGTPYMPPIWQTLVQKRLITVGEFLPPPPKFLHFWETASLTTWTLYSRQQANFGMCYVVARAYSLEHQNAGRAYAGLCHASSTIIMLKHMHCLLSADLLRSSENKQSKHMRLHFTIARLPSLLSVTV